MSKQNMNKPPQRNSSDKDAAEYEKSRAQGLDKEASAKEASKPTGSENRTQSDGKPPKLDDETKDELHRTAEGKNTQSGSPTKGRDVLQALRNKED